MPHRSLLLSLLLLPLAVPSSSSAADRPVREARSDNGEYLLRIEPGRAQRRGLPCEATLLKRNTDRERERVVWERALVNETAPTHAFIRDDGRYVVTLNEYRFGGARNALVIYGHDGRLLRHFLLQDLLPAEAWEDVKADRKRIDWLDGAKFTFTEDQPHFVITLRSGRAVRVDLSSLACIHDGTDPLRAQLQTIPVEMLALMLGHLEGDAASDLQQRLAALQPDPATTRPAAAELAPDEMPANLAELEATPPNPSPSDEALAATEEERIDTELDFLPRNTAGIDIPLPDPHTPVDYVAWLNSLGEVGGPDARPLYDEALAALPAWDGPELPVRDAAQGDPDALAADGWDAWLDAHAAAMSMFRDASQWPAKGWSFASKDGAMLSIQLPELRGMRELSRATVIAGRLAQQAERPDVAAGAYLDALAAGAHTGGGPTLIENLVGIAMQDVAADALLDLHADPAADELEAAELYAETELAFRPPRPPTEALQFERAMALDVLQRAAIVDPDTGAATLDIDVLAEQFSWDDPERAAENRLRFAAIADVPIDDQVAIINRRYDRLTNALELPYAEARAQIAEVERELESPDANPLLTILMPSISRYHFVHTRHEAKRRAALLVAELRTYRQTHGRYPASLAALGSAAAATDPFTDAPFVYEATGDDFLLYSAGGNLTDDGGRHDRRGEENDLVFWPRPAPER
jgi:hypothetical protein